MRSQFRLMLLVLLGLTPFGVATSLFGVASAEMAATAGLTLDEMSLVNILFMTSQVLGFIACGLLIRAQGLVTTIKLALSGGTVAAVLLANASNPLLITLGWGLMGLSVSSVMIGITQLVLSRCSYREMTLMAALMLVLTTLAPMGLYPWLLASITAEMNWQLLAILVAAFMLLALLWLIGQADRLTASTQAESNPVPERSPWQCYLALSSGAALMVYLLMRGEYYNWFDTGLYTLLWAAALALLAIGFVFRSKGQNCVTQSDKLLGDFKFLVFVYNGFLAGFAVMVSGNLLIQFLQTLLGYNHINTGWVQIISFATMLLGMLLSVLACNQNRFPADALTPIGVAMILISVWMMSSMTAEVGPDNLMLPMCLRGLGVGLLNVSVTIAVFAYIKPRQRTEGLVLFYLIRTFGGIMGGALFGWWMQLQKHQMTLELSNVMTAGKSSIQSAVAQISGQLVNSGYLPTDALISGQMQLIVKGQSANLALSNGLIWFIACIGVMGPILLVGKKIAARTK